MALTTLPDYLDHGLRLLSIGLNPSLPSVRAGRYFANPRNRFWTALAASQLLPGEARDLRDERELMRRFGIGFTDVVKRPTRGAHELRAADYHEWAPLLQRKITEYQPACAWFHGKVAYTSYLRSAGERVSAVAWGRQPLRIGDSAVFVTPNPSPANAAFSVADLVGWYDKLAEFLEERP